MKKIAVTITIIGEDKTCFSMQVDQAGLALLKEVQERSEANAGAFSPSFEVEEIQPTRCPYCGVSEGHLHDTDYPHPKATVWGEAFKKAEEWQP